MLSSRMRCLRCEEGFTMVELLLAIMLMSISLAGVMGSLDAGGKLTLQAERHEQAVSVAQREIERLSEIPYAELGLASMPSHECPFGGLDEGAGCPTVGDDGEPVGEPYPDYPLNPHHYVEGAPGTSFLIMADYGDMNSTGWSEPLWPAPDGVDAPASGPEQIEVVDAERRSDEEECPNPMCVTVWRYVTCREMSGDDCDTKRITVAVLPEPMPGVGPFRPFYLSTIVTGIDEVGP